MVSAALAPPRAGGVVSLLRSVVRGPVLGILGAAVADAITRIRIAAPMAELGQRYGARLAAAETEEDLLDEASVIMDEPEFQACTARLLRAVPPNAIFARMFDAVLASWPRLERVAVLREGPEAGRLIAEGIWFSAWCGRAFQRWLQHTPEEERAPVVARTSGPSFRAALVRPDVPAVIADALLGTLRSQLWMAAIVTAGPDNPGHLERVARLYRNDLFNALRFYAGLPGTCVPTSVMPLEARIDVQAALAEADRFMESVRADLVRAAAGDGRLYPDDAEA